MSFKTPQTFPAMQSEETFFCFHSKDKKNRSIKIKVIEVRGPCGKELEHTKRKEKKNIAIKDVKNKLNSIRFVDLKLVGLICFYSIRKRVENYFLDFSFLNCDGKIR